jgi:hypothetical protein
MSGVVFAQSPNQTQYGNPASTVKVPSTTVQGTSTAATTTALTPPSTTTTAAGATTTGGGTLPFTGLQLGLVVAFALVLILLGLGMRRLGRRGTG